MHCLVLTLLAGSVAGPLPEGSFLYRPAFCLDHVLRRPAEPYAPQPGDVFLSTDRMLIARVGHRLALSGPPQHSGIVFAMPDGSPALLEAGPHDTLRVRLLEVVPLLKSYEDEGELVFVRRRAVPLTAEESRRLTCFALAQGDKRFAALRVAGQVTPFRSRGPLRTWFLGKPRGERNSYFCSELVLEACVAAGLINPETARPSATYPRDLFFGDSPNPYLHRHLDVNCGWLPPARWVSCPAE